MTRRGNGKPESHPPRRRTHGPPTSAHRGAQNDLTSANQTPTPECTPRFHRLNLDSTSRPAEQSCDSYSRCCFGRGVVGAKPLTCPMVETFGALGEPKSQKIVS